MQICKTVTLRQRPLKQGMVGLYLDYYPKYRDPETMKVIRHQSLGIYIYANPKTPAERQLNKSLLQKAEIIRGRRYEEVVSERYNLVDQNRMRGDFLAFYEKMLSKHDQKWEFVYQHFSIYVHGQCSFQEIDLELCNGFREYLLSAKQLSNPKLNISRNSAAGYWSTFRGMLKYLYRNRYIATNLNDFLDRIDTTDVVKDYLSEEELCTLAETDCSFPVLKTASLFACLTGLRISDITALRWEDITDYSAGGKCIHIITQKTKSEDIIPISKEALELIGYTTDKTGKVFVGLKRSLTNQPLKHWILSAGIKKNITFHSFRRTFATLQAAAGTDIRTIQSMMAHKSITTTQRYMKVVDSNKRDASDRISLKRKS